MAAVTFWHLFGQRQENKLQGYICQRQCCDGDVVNPCLLHSIALHAIEGAATTTKPL
jgi:hypothetical protein